MQKIPHASLSARLSCSTGSEITLVFVDGQTECQKCTAYNIFFGRSRKMQRHIKKSSSIISILMIAVFFLTQSVFGQSFWHGLDITDSGMAPENMKAIHEAIKVGMTDLAPTPTCFPTGDMVNDDHRCLRIYDPDKAWKGYTLLNCFTPTGTDPNGNNVLIDMEGNIVNAWLVPGQASCCLEDSSSAVGSIRTPKEAVS
jgi:hypothetical protein